MASVATSSRPARANERVSTLIYRSRETRQFSRAALSGLVDAAQRRNRRARVTGCLVYDRGRFLQWLEGPAEGVGSIARSIRRDARHTDIEILRESEARGRVFGDWAMRVAIDADRRASSDPQDALTTTPALVRCLHGPTDQVAARFAELAQRHAARKPAAARDLDQLVHLAVDGRADDLVARFGEAAPAYASVRSAVGLATAMAMRLRRGWRTDALSAREIDVALAMTAIAVRETTRGRWRHAPRSRGDVLICPLPGEHHLLNATLADELMFDAGWSVETAYPATWHELADMASGLRPDRLLLCASPVVARGERLQAPAARRAMAALADRAPMSVIDCQTPAGTLRSIAGHSPAMRPPV